VGGGNEEIIVTCVALRSKTSYQDAPPVSVTGEAITAANLNSVVTYEKNIVLTTSVIIELMD
jgi:hypothetical protein